MKAFYIITKNGILYCGGFVKLNKTDTIIIKKIVEFKIDSFKNYSFNFNDICILKRKEILYYVKI